MKRRKATRIITLLLACVMVFTPTASQAADTQDGVIYVRDEDGNRIGIESAIIDGMTYYDIYDGSNTNRAGLATPITFLTDVIEKENEGNSLLDSWAELAYAIYASEWEYAHINDGYFEYCDLLKEPTSYIPEKLVSKESGGDSYYGESGSAAWECYIRSYTGLQLATSLSAVKEKIYDVAYNDASAIGFGGLTRDTVKDGLKDVDVLSILDDDTYDTVLYSLVDITEFASSDSGWYDGYINNNIYGIAFYDFQLQVMANDELSYVSAAEGYDDLEDAAADGASGVTYKTSSGGDNNMNYYQNGSDEKADVGMEFTQSDSMEVSNTMEETKTYEFSEMIGSETKLTAGIPEIWSLEQTFKAEFTSKEALSTAYSESTSVMQETSSTVTTSMNLPAQTAVSIESSTGTTNASVDYDCPIALTYKVAVFSISPQWYSVLTYTVDPNFKMTNCSGLSTVFGSEYEIGGQDAITNLYNRAITYQNMDSFDRSYGQVTGNYRNGANHIDNLNWQSILNGEINLGDLEKETLPIYIERYTVDSTSGTASEGDLISQSLYGNGYIGYETTVEVTNTYTSTDDYGNEILYTLYEGPVYDSDGNNLNADLKKNDTVDNYYSKSVVPKSDTTCKAKFYYTEVEEQPQTTAVFAPDTEESVVAEISGEIEDEAPIVVEETENTAEPQEAENTVSVESETIPETVVEAEEIVESEETAASGKTAEPEETAAAEETSEPEETAATEEIAAAEETAEPEETAAAEETAEPEKTAAAEETVESVETEAVVEETAEPEETAAFAEESAAPEEIAEIAAYDLTAAAQEIAEAEEIAEPEEAEVYETPADSYEDEVIIEDGDLIGSVSNGGTVAGIDSNGSSAGNEGPALTIESIEVVESVEIPEELQDGEDTAAEEAQESTDIMPMSSDMMPLANIEGVNDDVIWIVTHKPMSVTGATLNVTGKSTSSEIYGIVPIYPLDYTSVTSDQKIFDMITGTTLNVDNILVDGFNENDVEYYGFSQNKGYWILADEDGNELEESTVASLSTNANTGVTLLSADGEGTVYLKYMIDENTSNYSDIDGSEPVTNNDLSSAAMVQINVANGPFYGTVIADGTLVGYANETDDDYERMYINLDTCDTINAVVYDETDKKVSNPAITWEAREDADDGITIEDDQLYFTEPGTYHIRAIYGYSTINSNPYSDWIEITALPEKVLDELTIEDVTDPATLSDIILGDGYETINLGWLDVSGIDQYELDWTKFDKLKWYVDDEEVEPNDAGSYLYTATEAGDHIIYARCTDPDGKYNVKSNELTLTVLPERKLSSIKITDSTSPKTLAEVTYGEGKENVDLSKLTVSGTDQYGDKWADLDNLKWYVDGQALTGSIYTVKETSGGTHSIYAQCDGVKSNELSISVKVPATSVKLNKESLEIKDGKAKQLTATMTPAGTTDTVTWTSSNKKVATVSADGTVTAVSPGTATITAKTTSGKTATCQVHAVYKKNETFTKGSYSYIVKDASTDGTGKVTMTGFAKGKSRKKLTVPDTVTVNGTTYKVTAIANKAFKGNSTIKSFTSGKNLTTIGTSAFEGCQNLKTVTIGNSVKKINFKAFYDCYKLKTLSIGKNVNYMGAHCFCNDSKLQKITIKTTKLKKKNVESPHVFINVDNATMKVPKSKYKDYKKLFTSRYYGGKITKKK